MEKFNLTIYLDDGKVIRINDDPEDLYMVLSDIGLVNKPEIFGGRIYKFEVERVDD